ncbi:flagellar M-ring protein FliF C-terminal domain-containing protein, partial [Staphylococcus aureus]
YDRSITQIKRSRGRLEKLSVAVVLNSAAAPNPKTGWTPAELGNIEKMLSSGLGINAQRGDSLSLTALAFPAKPPVAQWWEAVPYTH